MAVTRIALRRQYPDRLRIALPPKFCEEQGLNDGDYAYLIQEDNDTFKLKFVKVAAPEEMEPAE